MTSPFPNSRATRKRLLGVASVLVSVALICWLVSRLDRERTVGLLLEAHPGWLLVAFLCVCAMPLCATFRWLGVLRAQSGMDLPFPTALRAVMTANVLNSFMPSKAGDMAKAVFLRERGGLAGGAGTVLLERMVDLALLGALGMTGFFRSGVLWGLWGGGGLLCVVVGAFAFLLWVPLGGTLLPAKWTARAEDLRRVFRLWVRSPRAIAQTVAGSLGNWVLAGITVCVLLSALGRNLNWGYAFSTFPLAILAGLVPLTVSGIGTRDSAFVLFLSAHVPVEEATLVGIGYTFFVYWMLSVVSLPAVVWQVRAVLRGAQAERGTS